MSVAGRAIFKRLVPLVIGLVVLAVDYLPDRPLNSLSLRACGRRPVSEAGRVRYVTVRVSAGNVLPCLGPSF